MHRDGRSDDARGAIGTRAARDALVVACAVSAGVHAALTPEHLREEPAAGAVLAGLLVLYAVAVTTGVPLLHPDVEPADGLGLVTKAVELVGLLAVVRLALPVRSAGRPIRLQPKGTTT